MERTIQPDTLKTELAGRQIDSGRAKGLNVRFIEGGIEGWKNVGGEVR